MAHYKQLIQALQCVQALDLPAEEGVPILTKAGWDHGNRFDESASDFVMDLIIKVLDVEPTKVPFDLDEFKKRSLRIIKEQELNSNGDITQPISPEVFDLDEFRKDLKSLLKRYNVELSVDIQGDTHCLNESFIVTDNTARLEYTLAEHSFSLSHSDL